MKRRNSTWLHAAFVATSLMGASLAFAEDQKPDNEVSYNAAITTDYRYRGISQTRLNPALQGGADYVNNPTGLYAGTWLSTIHWIKDAGGDDNVEWDIYGGKKGNITDAITYDVGGLYYLYPSNGLHPSANTFEVYGQIGFGPAYIKYSHSLTNLFATPDSKGSGYLDVGANVDMGTGLTLNLHAGHQEVRHLSAASYTDYKLGVTKDFGVATLAVAYVYADTKFYVTPSAKNLGKSGLVLTVSKTF